jgi:hypothetical protein
MTLTGKAAEDFVAKALGDAERRRAAELDAAKADAARRGKEPFDLARLEALCDTSHEGRMPPVEERRAELERKYYVYNPDVMTLEEFARVVAESNRW